MALRTGQSYWQAVDTPGVAAPQLIDAVSCEVAVLGGGVTGALIAYYLTRIGVDVVLVDKRPLGTGSTAASTGLLQYEIDTPLVDLIGKVGEAHARHAYRRGREAIDEVQMLVEELDQDCGFRRASSLYFASRFWHQRRLKHEFACRRDAGFDVEYLDRRELASRTTIRAAGAILSQGDAQIDPFQLTQRLLARGQAMGLRLFANTEIERIDEADAEGVALYSATGRVQARYVVFAAGYDCHRYLSESVGSLHSTYAVASEPLSDTSGWPDACLIWETARPYFYARQTADGRAIIGGGDTVFSNDFRREGLVNRKIAALQRRFTRLFPHLEFTPAFAWAGVFAETKDGLPYIGKPNGRPKAFFALGYGGNGITFSVIAAQLIRDLFLGVPNEDAAVFRFGR